MSAATDKSRRTLIRIEIDEYLGCFRHKISEFTDYDSAGEEDREWRRRFFEFLAVTARHPGDVMWNEVIARLQRIYHRAIEKTGDGPTAAERRRLLHKRLRKSRVPFVTWSEDDSSYRTHEMVIGRRQLTELYDKAWNEKPRAGRTPATRADGDTANLSITWDRDKITAQDVVGLLENILKPLSLEVQQQVLRDVGIKLGIFSLVTGCTTIKIEVPREIADHLVAAFREGRLPEDILAVQETDRRTVFHPGKPAIPDNAPEAEAAFRRLWFKLRIRQAVIEPWRRLRWLFSPNIAGSPVADVIHDSDGLAYASPELVGKNLAAFGSELVMAWLIWPFLSTLLLYVTLLPLAGVLPDLAIRQGILAGLILAFAGGQICASVVAPTAAGAGAVLIAWAFGLAQAIAIGQMKVSGVLVHKAIEDDFFIAVTGGAVGLSVTRWPGHVPAILIVLVLAGIAASIAASGWLMSQPMRAGEYAMPKWRDGLRSWILRIMRMMPGGHAHIGASGPGAGKIAAVGGMIGASVGACIGVTFAVHSLFMTFGLSPAAAFSWALGIVGGSVFGFTVKLAGKRGARGSAICAAVYFVAVFALCHVIDRANDAIGLIALSALTAMYHATWFTGAFLVGAQFSRRAAIVATALEGGVGFTVFIMVLIIHG